MPRTTDDIVHRDSIPILADRLIVEVTGWWYQMKCRLLKIFLQKTLRSQRITSQGFRSSEWVFERYTGMVAEKAWWQERRADLAEPSFGRFRHQVCGLRLSLSRLSCFVSLSIFI